MNRNDPKYIDLANKEIESFLEETNALIDVNNKLISALKKAYAKLADISHEWKGRHTTEGQTLLCDMRDAIAKATNTDPETVQDYASKVQA